MEITYGQLSTIIYSIVYDEAAYAEIEDVETLLDYLNNNEDKYIRVLW